MCNFFLTHKTIEKYLSFFFQPILKSSDLTNPRYIEQKFSASSDFAKTRFHCIFSPLVIVSGIYITWRNELVFEYID